LDSLKDIHAEKLGFNASLDTHKGKRRGAVKLMNYDLPKVATIHKLFENAVSLGS
jgi:hypothetical protein